MQLSTRGRYAVMAMVHLAGCANCTATPVTLAEIAGAQCLSLAYLEQLFGRLRRAGLVCSARGPGGGYRLGRQPCGITIADIVCAVDESLDATRCEGGIGCLVQPGTAPTRCQTHDLWEELGRQIYFFLAGVTLDDVLCQRVAGRAVQLDGTFCPVPQAAQDPVA
jgi:Rrf2 family iron-sulfur cluster assembly transcriptional regulator